MESSDSILPSVLEVDLPNGGSRYRPSRFLERSQALPEPRWSIKDW